MANAVKNEKNYRNAIGEKLNSGFIIERADAMAVNEEGQEDSRIVELSFASNKPIGHYFGYLELDMSNSSVRLERMNLGAALLWNHNSDEQIGVVQSVSLDKDGKARATVKFSRSECGEENYQDVLDGIKRNVSVGFIPHTIEQKVDGKGKQVYENGEPVYISRDWEPFEISLVSIPADISVGVGRSLDNFEGEKREMEGQNPTTQTEPAVIPPVQVDTRSDAEKRDDLFLAIGRKFGNEEIAKRYALAGKTEAELRQALFEAIPATDSPAQMQRQTTIEPAQISFRGSLQAFKGERAAEKAYRAGQFILATIKKDEKAIQYCNEQGLLKRAQTSTDNSLGGVLVPEEFESTIIDLRIEYGVFRPNARVLPMSRDTKTQPRRKSGLTAYAVGPGDTITESTKGWDSITFNAKKWGVLSKYESEVSADSVIAMADDLAQEIAYAFAQKEDECGFNGDGTSTYHGIVGLKNAIASATAGLQTAAGSTYASVTLANMNALIGKLPQFARRRGGNKFYCSYGVFANVLTRLAQSVGGVTYGEIAGMLKEQFFGIPVEIVEVMPAAEASGQICLYYGNLAMAATLGDREGVSIKMSDSNEDDFVKDIMAIRGLTRFDINCHNVGDSSNAGPIVGLKLA